MKVLPRSVDVAEQVEMVVLLALGTFTVGYLTRVLTKRHHYYLVPINIKSLGANFQYLKAHL